MTIKERKVGPRVDLSVLLKEGADVDKVVNQVRGRKRVEYVKVFPEETQDPFLANLIIVRVYPRSAEDLLVALKRHEGVDIADRSGDWSLASSI
jgi:hypothetical protein